MGSLRENNLTLLRNILPEHVANNFLGKSRRDEVCFLSMRVTLSVDIRLIWLSLRISCKILIVYTVYQEIKLSLRVYFDL